MNMQPKVSIIMNCYNGEKYLKQSIGSILKQSYKNWELIFWDNKSTDYSKKIVKKFNDKRIKYFYSKKFNKLYYSRNLAIRKATGKYICFLDADDYWKKNFIRDFLKKFTLEKCNIVISKYQIKHEKKKDIYINTKMKLPNILTTQELLNNYIIGVNAIMIKKTILKKFKFNKDYNIIGDFDLFIKLSQLFNFYTINKPLAIYRVHDDNFSRKKLNIYVLELKKWLKTTDQVFKNKFNVDKIKIFLLKQKIKYFLAKVLMNKD